HTFARHRSRARCLLPYMALQTVLLRSQTLLPTPFFSLFSILGGNGKESSFFCPFIFLPNSCPSAMPKEPLLSLSTKEGQKTVAAETWEDGPRYSWHVRGHCQAFGHGGLFLS